MRTIRVERKESDSSTMLLVAAGAAIGLVSGALIAERLSGRKLSTRTLMRRARGLVGLAARRWKPLLDTAVAVGKAWAAREEDEELDEIPKDENDDFMDDELDDELDGEMDDEMDDDEFDSDGIAGLQDEGLDARVLEAFSHDPVMAERDVEIEEAEDGRIVLHGRVHTAREVAHAVTIARGVPGVTSVKQRLAVRDRR